MIELVSVLGIALCGWLPLGFTLALARAGRSENADAATAWDRRTIVDWSLAALAGLVATRLLVPWGAVPALLWAIPAAVAAYGVLLAVPLWRRVPWARGPHPKRKVVGTAVNLAVAATLGVLLVA